MKKFNIDELIWFIVLILLSLSIIILIKSGQITNFVNADMVIYFYISIVILSVFTAFQFSRIFTMRRRIEITNKFIPLTFTLCIGVILLYVFPLLKGNNNINNDLSFYKNENTILISNENYEILNEIDKNKENYEGKNIIFLGYVDKIKDNSNLIFISRQFIDCCQADKGKIQVRAKGIQENLKEGQWINIYGKIYFDDKFYIEIEDYRLQNEPTDVYFHQHL